MNIDNMTDSSITLKTDLFQLIDMAGQGDHFDIVVADRLNKPDVSVADREKGVREAINLLGAFYDRDVEARGGTLSAATLTDIMKRGIDSLRLS